MYICRADFERYGPTKGRPVCQKVISAPIPSCIVATHSAEYRDRMEKSMMQDPEGADRVSPGRDFFLMKRLRHTYRSMTRDPVKKRSTVTKA